MATKIQQRLIKLGRKLEQSPENRNAAGGLRMTIFGATGQLGGNLVEILGAAGAKMICPFRGDELEVRHLRPSVDYGNIGFIPYDVRDKDVVREAIEGSDVVVNLIGKHYQTEHVFGQVNFSYHDVNVKATQTIAEISQEMGVPRLIQMSSLAADLASPSVWAKTKAEGEIAAVENFPGATIVRAAPIFGFRDRLTNWNAMTAANGLGLGLGGVGIPLVDGGNARIAPVSVVDVAKIIKVIAHDDQYQGKLLELAGPDEYTYRELAEFVLETTQSRAPLTTIPGPVAEWLGWSLTKLHPLAAIFREPTFTEDQARLYQIDQVVDPNSNALKLEDFASEGVEPTTMESIAFQWLHRFKEGGHFKEVEGYH